MDLRPYQKDCLFAIERKFLEGKRKLLVSVPTGGGKTLIFTTYSVEKNLRTLVLVHRDELLQQTLDKYLMVGGDPLKVGEIRAGVWRENHFTVASLQTLSRNLGRIDGGRYDVVVVDEAHHLPAPSYRSVINRLFETNPDLKLLGFTATPYRSDDRTLSEFFDDLAYAIDVLELLRLGYLIPVRARLFHLPVSLDHLKVKKVDGEEDFLESSISELFNHDHLNEEVVKRWIEYGEGRKTVFYLSSLQHAKALQEAFLRNGIPAGYVDGKTPLEERREVLREFKEGRIRVLTNVNVLTEGFDDPELECVGLVRPTKSLTLYAQMVGRGLRIGVGKRDCLILEFTGETKRHSLASLDTFLGLPSVREGLERGEEVCVGAVEGEGGERVVRVLVGGGSEEFVFEGKEASEYATRVGGDVVVSCGLSGKVLLLKRENHLYDLYLLGREERRVLRRGLTEDYAWTTLSVVWKKERDEFMSFYKDKALKEPPSEKQLQYLAKVVDRGILKEIPEKLDKLTASNLLAYAFLLTSPSELNADVLVEIKEGKFVSEGREVRLAHLKLFEEMGKKVRYPARCVKEAVEERSVRPLQRWVFLQVKDVAKQVGELVGLEKGRLPVPSSWIEGTGEEGKERLRRWVRENSVKVYKDGSVFTFLFPSPSELGEKLEELLKEVLVWF